MSDTPEPPNGNRKLFYGLFIFPLVIAVGMALILCTVVFLTHEQESPENLIEGLVKTSPGKRWQKAFELSNEFNRHPDKASDPAIRRRLLAVLSDAEHYDAKTRGYVAIALTHGSDTSSQNALIQSLENADEEYALYALWALGQTQCVPAIPSVQKFLSHDSAALRQVAAYVLGAIGDASAAPSLVSRLEDSAPDVRWNAALALARLRRTEGAPILREMLDRNAIAPLVETDENRMEQVMTNAIKGILLIPSPDSIKILESLSRNDKNMKVRQAAIQALNILEKQS